MPKLRSALLSLLFVLLVSLIAILLMGDLNVRYASFGRDDNPVLYAYFLQNPYIYDRDLLSTYGRVLALGTLQNWLPAVLLQTMSLPPEITAWVLVYLQNVLLGLALLYFTRQVTGRTDLAWLTVFFAYAAQPWAWNLGVFDSMMFFPYSAHLALPFLVFAAAAAIGGHFFRVLGLLGLAGLIHPALALSMVLTVAGFWLLQNPFRQWRHLMARQAPLALVAAISVVPAMAAQYGGDPLSTADWMRAFRLNLHITPWDSTEWSLVLPTFAGFMFLAALALRIRERTTPAFLVFCLASLGATVLLGLLHLAGLFWEIPLLLQVVPLRATLLLVVFLLPLVVAYLAMKSGADRFPARWAATGLLLLLAFFSSGLFWGFILALFLSELAEGRLGSLVLGLPVSTTPWLRRAAWVVLVGWSGLVLLALAYSLTGPSQATLASTISLSIPGISINFPRPRFYTATALALGALSLLLAARLPLNWLNRLFDQLRRGLGSLASLKPHPETTKQTLGMLLTPVTALVVVLVGLTMLKAWETRAETTSAWAKGWFEAQLWARDNTAQDAMFIVADAPAWRTVSHRPILEPRTTSGYNVYSRSRSGKQFDEEILQFYGLDGAFGRVSGVDLIAAQRAAYQALDEDGIRRLAQRFGGDYVVRPAGVALKFPIAYANDQVVIYRLSSAP